MKHKTETIVGDRNIRLWKAMKDISTESDLSRLSDAILLQVKTLSKVKESNTLCNLIWVIDQELKALRELNSKICKLMEIVK